MKIFSDVHGRVKWGFYQQTESKYIIRATQHGFIESKSCQTNTVFYDRLIGPVGKGECVGTAFFIFKPFDLVTQNSLV